MRYFLDAEFNGFGGQLFAGARAQGSGSSSILRGTPVRPPEPWVADHVLPILQTRPISRPEMIATLAAYLRGDSESEVVADWPEDIAHLALLMVTGPG